MWIARWETQTMNRMKTVLGVSIAALIALGGLFSVADVAQAPMSSCAALAVGIAQPSASHDDGSSSLRSTTADQGCDRAVAHSIGAA